MKFKLKQMGYITISLLLSQTAFAAEHAQHTPSIVDLKWPWLNFIIYCAALYFLARKSILAAWDSRRQEIYNSVNAAKIKADQAKAELLTVQAKLASVTTEALQIAEDTEKESRLEAEEIVENAKRRAARLLSQAKDTVVAERKSAETAIRKEIVEMAISKAKYKITSEMNIDSDRSLRDIALSSVGGLAQ